MIIIMTAGDAEDAVMIIIIRLETQTMDGHGYHDDCYDDYQPN